MTPNTLSDEEFKKVLKSLFTEKKRFKEFRKKLDEKGLQKKFQAKLSDIHKLSLIEEYAKLKTAYFEKKKECEEKKDTLEKVKPAIKKLFQELHESKSEIEKIKFQSSEELRKAVFEKEQQLEKAKDKIIFLEKEKIEGNLENEKRENAGSHLLAKNLQLEKRLQEEIRIKKTLEEHLFDLEKALGGKEAEIAKKTKDEEKEFKRFEEEKAKIVKKLAESLSQIQFQNETIKELKTSIEKSDAGLVRKEMEELLGKKEKCFEETLDAYYKKMRELSQMKGHLIEENENLLVRLEKKIGIEKEWGELKEDLVHLKILLEEKEKELCKARRHLAKKVKETTLLADLFHNQNIQMNELQERFTRQREELEQMTSTLTLKNLNEERLLSAAEEKRQANERVLKEWQEKYLALQEEWQEKKNQLAEFQKMKTQYEQMAQSFSELRAYLGKSLENSTEDPSH